MKAIILNKDAEYEIALPEDGFDEEFLNDVRTILESHFILRAYLALNLTKRNPNDICLLFGLVYVENFSRLERDNSNKTVLNDIINLFNEKITVNVFDLTDDKRVESQFVVLTEPFYRCSTT